MASKELSAIISSSPIVVFSDPGCPYCKESINVLHSVGQKPLVVNANSAQRQELYKLTGKTSVPSIWIQNKYVGGCNDGPEAWMGIKKIIKNNQLATFLTAKN